MSSLKFNLSLLAYKLKNYTKYVYNEYSKLGLTTQNYAFHINSPG